MGLTLVNKAWALYNPFVTTILFHALESGHVKYALAYVEYPSHKNFIE